MQPAACYLRVSSEGQTYENQRAEVEALARARGYSPIWYEEQQSAAKSRPAFDAMMRDARAGKVGAVVVWALDRYHRSLVGSVRDVQELDRLKVRVLSVRESWLDTDEKNPARSLLIAIFGWVAEQERARLIERTHAGLERARREGRRLGRPRASPVLLSAAADRVAGGASVRRAAGSLGVSEATLRRFLKERASAPQ